jgi:hypothetical protein
VAVARSRSRRSTGPVDPVRFDGPGVGSWGPQVLLVGQALATPGQAVCRLLPRRDQQLGRDTHGATVSMAVVVTEPGSAVMRSSWCGSRSYVEEVADGPLDPATQTRSRSHHLRGWVAPFFGSWAVRGSTAVRCHRRSGNRLRRGVGCNHLIPELPPDSSETRWNWGIHARLEQLS